MGGVPYKPEIGQLDVLSSIIGLNLTLCLQGTAAGFNGSAYWSVDDQVVIPHDITDTQPRPNIANYISPTCTMCSCYNKYLEITSIQEKLTKDLNEFGYSAFILSYYSFIDDLDELSLLNHLCGLPDVFLSFLIIREVSGATRAMNIKFALSDGNNRSSSKSYLVNASKLCVVSVLRRGLDSNLDESVSH